MMVMMIMHCDNSDVTTAAPPTRRRVPQQQNGFRLPRRFQVSVLQQCAMIVMMIQLLVLPFSGTDAFGIFSAQAAPRATSTTATNGATMMIPSSRSSISTTATTNVGASGAAAISSYGSDATTTNNNSKREAIPFLIERLPGRPNPGVFEEIADMCITAFFNDNCAAAAAAANGKTGMSRANAINSKTPLWKELQLAYLRKLQTGDLERRRRRDGDKNIMFVARRVVPATAKSARRTPLLLDLTRVHNFANGGSGDGDFVRAEIVGFVEVTQRPYGLGNDDEGDTVLRPVLTNLSVRKEARGSGVGSELVAACEKAVTSSSEWNMREIVLEVEEDNVRAQQFYQNRGYKGICTDPASRRYDTTGLWLQQVRCKRLVMRKDLNTMSGKSAASVVEGTMNMGIQVLQRLRDNFMFSLSESLSEFR